MAGLAEQKQPPRALRERILASVSPAAHSRPWKWAIAIAALGITCIVLAVLSFHSRSEMNRLRDQIAAQQDQLAALTFERDQLAAAVGVQRNQLRAALAVVSRPDTRTLPFGTGNAPHGRVFTSRTGGLVFVGTQLPRISPNRTFELWLVPKTGAPRPAGLFRQNTTGEALHVSSLPVDPAATKAVAVTIEPRQGSPEPTSTPILVVPMQ